MLIPKLPADMETNLSVDEDNFADESRNCTFHITKYLNSLKFIGLSTYNILEPRVLALILNVGCNFY